MRLYFLKSPTAMSPEFSGDFATPNELRLWLVERPETFYIAVECVRGPVIVLGPQAGDLWVRGGLTIPMSDVINLWNYCDLAMRRDDAMEQFLNGVSSFTRRAAYPAPRLVK